MTDEPLKPEDAANLRFLRVLVTVLTATMIGGLLVIIALFVIRFSDTGPDLPDRITLPEGARASAYTQGDGWYAVVTQAGEILIYSAATGTLRQRIPVDLGADTSN
jgi:hypothetical protein